MNNKRKLMIVAIVIVLLGVVMFISFNNNESKSTDLINDNEVTEGMGQGSLDFLNAIAGVKAENIEIINSPVIGIKGKVFVPDETMINGINYFLKKTNNDKMSNLEIDVDDNKISIYVNYSVTKKLKTPIKVDIVPSLNENKDLVIDVGDVKFLDLKIANFLVDLALKTFVKDWFNSDSNIKVDYNKGDVIIYKENFKGVSLESLSVENHGLSLDAIIDGKILILE